MREKPHKDLLNGTKMFLRIYFCHITNEEMFKTSKILDLGWKKLKVAENVLTLGKAARSCSLAKKLLKIPYVVQKLLSTICLGLPNNEYGLNTLIVILYILN